MKHGLCVAAALLLSTPIAAASQHAPEQGWIVWASDRAGARHDIYLARADGNDIKRLTFAGGYRPSWSPEGDWIAYEEPDSGTGWILKPDGSSNHRVCTGAPLFWLHDGRGLVCRVEEDRYVVVDVERDESSALFSKADFQAVARRELNPYGISADSRFLLAHTDRYRRGYEGSNGFFRAYHAAVLLDFANPDAIFYLGQGCQPASSPVDDWIYHVCAGSECPTGPDIMRLRIGDRHNRADYQPVVARPDEDWGHSYMPRPSNDGLWLAYAATTDGCHDQATCDYEVFIHRLGGDQSSYLRLTHHPGNDGWPHLRIGPLWQPTSDTD